MRVCGANAGEICNCLKADSYLWSERIATPDPSGSVPLIRARQYLCTERGMYPHPERGMYPHPERGMYSHPERGMYPHPERGVPLHRTVNSADRLSCALQQEPSDFAEVLFIFVSVSLCAYLWDWITCLSRTGEWSSPILDKVFIQLWISLDFYVFPSVL